MHESYKLYLKRLREEVWFQKFLSEEVFPAVPSIPSFNPSQDNTELWKHECAVREGYMLCLKKLGVDYGTGN